MRNIVFVALIILSFEVLFAEDKPLAVGTVATVSLKYGTATTGLVVEVVDNSYIKIMDKDGVIFTFSYDVIDSIKQRSDKRYTIPHVTSSYIITLKTGSVISCRIRNHVLNEYVTIIDQVGNEQTIRYESIAKISKEILPQRIAKSEHDGIERNDSDALTPDQRTQPSHQVAEPEQKTVAEEELPITEAEYRVLKRSPALGFVLGAFPGGIGHAYAGKWGRGMVFEAGQALVYVGTVLSVLSSSSFADGSSDNRGDAMLYILGAVRLLEMIDASLCVSEYNKKLESRIRKEKTSDVSFDLYCSKNGENTTLGISVSF